jgi:protein O-mannosyl-transferase
MAKKGQVRPQAKVVMEKLESKKTTAPSGIFKGMDFVTMAVLALLTYVVFLQVRTYEFVNWDDDRNVYENPLITSLNKDNFWDNSKAIFKTKVIGNYNPLTIWSFALENKMRSKNDKGTYTGVQNPGGWHMTNVFFHMICVLFSFMLSRRLGLKVMGAAFVAALFAIHPMRVESVAWVTERKDVLFGAFYLIALYYYVLNKEKSTLLRTLSIYVFFLLSLFSKIQAVSLPLSMLAIDFLLDKKLTLAQVLRKLPFFALSLGFGLYGLTALDAEGSLDTNSNTYAMWQRIFVGTYSYMVYIVKWIVPYRLSPLYPYDSKLPTSFYPTIVMLPITLFALWHAYKKQWYVFVFSLVFFTVNIFFLLQILGAGQGFIADRFSYIAYFGLFFGLGYLIDKLTATEKYKMVAYAGGGLMLMVYFFITIQQVTVWQNSATLWTHVLKYYNKTTLPFGNRANYYRSKKMYPEAISDYNSAIGLKSEPQTHNSRARLYFDTAGNDTSVLKKALFDYNKAIELSPKDGEFWINRGATYARLGNLEKAVDNINQGLIYKPDHETGYLNRFVLNLTLSDRYAANSPERNQLIEKAIADMDTYQKYRPYEANTWYEKARLKRMLGRITEAKADIDKALQLDATKPLYQQESAAINAAVK